jgi:hypothetical protein
MLDAIVLAATLLVAAKVAWGIVALSMTARHLKMAGEETPRTVNVLGSRIYVLIPLLREQARLPALLKTFGGLLAQFSCLRLVLVTTERETTESHLYGARRTTAEMLSDAHMISLLPPERFFHLHYPGNNQTLGQQSNFAIHAIWSKGEADQNGDYILTYNADSLIDDKTIRAFIDFVNQETRVVQQSALFLRNIEQLVTKKSYLAAADALFQSRWTLEREVPRYLIQARLIRCIPSVLARYWQVHCVGHGLLIHAPLLQTLGGIPEPMYGLEDSALGFALGVRGIPIAPLGVLENADAATDLRSLIRQKSTWVRATWGTLEYAIEAWRQGQRGDVAAAYAVQGLYTALKWSFGAPAFLVIVGLAYGGVLFAPLIALYFLYCYLPLSIVLVQWRRQQANIFPRVSMLKLTPVLAVYVLTPAIHGLSGILGFGKIVAQLATRRSFRQAKTT